MFSMQGGRSRSDCPQNEIVIDESEQAAEFPLIEETNVREDKPITIDNNQPHFPTPQHGLPSEDTVIEFKRDDVSRQDSLPVTESSQKFFI